ncbi:MAG: AAA family ATPase [Bradymonadales bacterium]|jgi:hypothetical protein
MLPIFGALAWKNDISPSPVLHRLASEAEALCQYDETLCDTVRLSFEAFQLAEKNHGTLTNWELKNVDTLIFSFRVLCAILDKLRSQSFICLHKTSDNSSLSPWLDIDTRDARQRQTSEENEIAESPFDGYKIEEALESLRQLHFVMSYEVPDINTIDEHDVEGLERVLKDRMYSSRKKTIHSKVFPILCEVFSRGEGSYLDKDECQHYAYYLPKVLQSELNFTAALHWRLGKNASDNASAINIDFETSLGYKLNESQNTALKIALQQPFTIITGYAHSGKTALIAPLVLALKEQGLAAEEIAVTSTSQQSLEKINIIFSEHRKKPANSVLNKITPQSISQILSQYQIRARRSAELALAYKCIIIDDAQLLYQDLCSKLLHASDKECRFILLVDPNALSQWEATAYLRNLIYGLSQCKGAVFNHRNNDSTTIELVDEQNFAGQNEELRDFTIRLRTMRSSTEHSATAKLLDDFNIRQCSVESLASSPWEELTGLKHCTESSDEALHSLLKQMLRSNAKSLRQHGVTSHAALKLAIQNFQKYAIVCANPYELSTINDIAMHLYKELYHEDDNGVKAKRFAPYPIRLTESFPQLQRYKHDEGLVYYDKNRQRRIAFLNNGEWVQSYAYEELSPAIRLGFVSDSYEIHSSHYEHALMILANTKTAQNSLQTLIATAARATKSLVIFGENNEFY